MYCSCIGICFPEPDPDKFMLGIFIFGGIVIALMVVLFIAERVITRLGGHKKETSEEVEEHAKGPETDQTDP